MLVQAGASAVGIAAIQLAKQAGATVIATASSEARLAKLKPLGLDHGIDYARADVPQEIMRLTDNKGRQSGGRSGRRRDAAVPLASLAYRGRISLVGNAGREPQKVDVSSLMPGNRSLTGVFLGAEIATDRVHDNIQRPHRRGRRRTADGADRLDLSAQRSGGRSRLYRKSRKAVGPEFC